MYMYNDNNIWHLLSDDDDFLTAKTLNMLTRFKCYYVHVKKCILYKVGDSCIPIVLVFVVINYGYLFEKYKFMKSNTFHKIFYNYKCKNNLYKIEINVGSFIYTQNISWKI